MSHQIRLPGSDYMRRIQSPVGRSRVYEHKSSAGTRVAPEQCYREPYWDLKQPVLTIAVRNE
ncbi:hypothetical protein DICSQDRAFT_175822 [Dichomitus squalens LYAD-421 SS1]|uniref:Uncharacterized protein n=1 Tax=Dichomitus squalens (strain LYAD-421) TaxID=732165 RepID=R7SIF3_DICSQ|nr:uncharacterized protein DICSQDRAFT_175822 [Dichomitus squalens LYAD-421 SS1]EJF55505.1 hypothetical protein DICSQDRAFT_175822 [Dichomitus squalens LYAD-421 SS1]